MKLSALALTTPAFAIGLLLAPTLAHADTRSDLEARYVALRSAMDSRQPANILPLLAPDFTSTDLGGTRSNADTMIDQLAMVPVDPARKSTTTIVSLTQQGETAEVEQRFDASESREGHDGTTHLFTMSALSHDTWVHTPKGWLYKATETEKMTISRDGVIVRTQKKGEAADSTSHAVAGPPAGR